MSVFWVVTIKPLLYSGRLYFLRAKYVSAVSNPRLHECKIIQCYVFTTLQKDLPIILRHNCRRKPDSFVHRVACIFKRVLNRFPHFSMPPVSLLHKLTYYHVYIPCSPINVVCVRSHHRLHRRQDLTQRQLSCRSMMSKPVLRLCSGRSFGAGVSTYGTRGRVASSVGRTDIFLLPPDALEHSYHGRLRRQLVGIVQVGVVGPISVWRRVVCAVPKAVRLYGVP